MIKVSVCMVCYNHEKYVAKAIESVLQQQTNFDFEILIYDDASTDNSPNIIREYQKKYPNIIKAILSSENEYKKGNARVTYKYDIIRAQGEYIAFCECDDFWLDTNKLQYQFDYLETHKNISMHLHAAKIVDSDGNDTHKVLGILGLRKKVTLENDMRVFYPTASKFCRKEIFDNIPEYYYIGDAGDLPTMLLILDFNDAYYEGLVMSAYRTGVVGSANARFNSSTFNKKKEYILDRVNLLRNFNKYKQYKINNSVCSAIVQEHNQIIVMSENIKMKICEYHNQKKMPEYNMISTSLKIKLFFRDFLPFYEYLAKLKNKIISIFYSN